MKSEVHEGFPTFMFLMLHKHKHKRKGTTKNEHKKYEVGAGNQIPSKFFHTKQS